MEILEQEKEIKGVFIPKTMNLFFKSKKEESIIKGQINFKLFY